MHIKDLMLKQLVGLWTCFDGNCSMWISDGTKQIVVKCDNKPIISEPTDFAYDKIKNECKISESVELCQLFEDGDICIRVTIGEQKIIRIQKKRE